MRGKRLVGSDRFRTTEAALEDQFLSEVLFCMERASKLVFSVFVVMGNWFQLLPGKPCAFAAPSTCNGPYQKLPPKKVESLVGCNNPLVGHSDQPSSQVLCCDPVGSSFPAGSKIPSRSF